MRLDFLYALGSLWGTGPQVCTSVSVPPFGTVFEAALSLGLGAPVRITAFVDVNVVPMDSDRVLPNQTVLVEGGRITALGPVSQVQVPAGATRIASKGKYLMPGLSNMHIHRLRVPAESESEVQDFADRMFNTYLSRGITAIRTVEDPHLKDMQRLRRILKTTELPMLRMYLAREIPRSLLAKPDSIAAYVTESHAAGYDHIGTSYLLKGRDPGERAVVDSLVAAARRVGLPVSAHAHALPFDAVLALGASGGATDHLYAFWDSIVGEPGPLTTMGYSAGKAPVYVSAEKITSLVAAVKRSGLWITPTLACMQGQVSHVKNQAELVKALHDAGVGLLLGDDGAEVNSELEALVRAGLTPYQALLTGTRNVAQYFGRLDSTGTVAVGKWADLVLLYDNPLENIKLVREPVGVMSNGIWLDRARLDRALLAGDWQQELLDAAKKEPVPGWVERAIARYRGEPVDSLEQKIRNLVELLGAAAAAEYPRVQRELATAFSTIRPVVWAEQRERFDASVRLWLREEARQGRPVTIPGFPAEP